MLSLLFHAEDVRGEANQTMRASLSKWFKTDLRPVLYMKAWGILSAKEEKSDHATFSLPSPNPFACLPQGSITRRVRCSMWLSLRRQRKSQLYMSMAMTIPGCMPTLVCPLSSALSSCCWWIRLAALMCTLQMVSKGSLKLDLLICFN